MELTYNLTFEEIQALGHVPGDHYLTLQEYTTFWNKLKLYKGAYTWFGCPIVSPFVMASWHLDTNLKRYKSIEHFYEVV